MKKSFVFLLLVFLLTGCSNNEVLECTNKENKKGLELKEKVDIEFLNKKVSVLTMNVSIKAIDDNSKNLWNDLIDFYTKKFPMKNEEGISIKSNNDLQSYNYNIDMKIDLKKVSKKALSTYKLEDIMNREETINDIKLEAEQNGFTCVKKEISK